ncbi:class I SAM-dependent methyltransferase [Methylobacterium sp. E-016]|uniref:class I SAM-dependent methyltransferase n=1 Tax=Methylobacterium sp. E-016 TaxID=2836556 RepID=UPI001FB9D6F6|nr:methyltransferase domain-containing protein [Methylobacterium sp. E-016]MCJ2074450.1 class I SAM-dependent methyltransferase [Methylobacterium sp. E-016]
MSQGQAEFVASPERTVLHVGCGLYAPEKLHPIFHHGTWREVRMDLDPRVRPDIVGSITDLSPFLDGTVEALWSSHNIEHLHDHEVPVALSEFRRVLRTDGFALITTPDIQAVAHEIAQGKLDSVAYISPAGPITPLDMLYGHRDSIRGGNLYMAHKTAFTAERLGRLLIEAGFSKVIVRRGANFDLWAVGLRPDAAPPDMFLDSTHE